MAANEKYLTKSDIDVELVWEAGEGESSVKQKGGNGTAFGDNSAVEGYYTTARNKSEHAGGQYNVSHSATTEYGSSGNTQHSVGIGTSSASTKNAFEIMQNGDVYVYGVGGYNGTNAGSSGVKNLKEVVNATSEDSVWEIGDDAGSIQSKGTGARAVGMGSLAHGVLLDDYGTIEATGDGSIADGFVEDGASISAEGNGSSAKGYAGSEGTIQTTINANGAQASGAAIFGGTGPGYIVASGFGSLAHGYSEGGVSLEARGRGAVALGFAGDDGDYYHASIASGDGSLVAGVSNTAQNVGEIGVGVYNKSHKKEDGTDEENKAGSTQFSVGVGYYDYEDGIVEQNAIEIMQNGDVYIAGVGDYDGTNPSSASTLQSVMNSKADTNHAKVADATASGKILASTGNGTYSWQNISSLSVADANNAVYAGHAITAGKLGSSTVGSSTIPIYLNSGQPSAITSFPEAYLSWGGQNFVNGFGPMDAALVPDLGACRTAFITPSCISAEYSRDGGSTWSSYSLTNEEKSNLFNGIGSSVRIGNNTTQGTDFINYQVRVIFNSIPESGLYTVLNKFIIYVGEEGCERSWCTIDARTQANVTNNVDTWDTFADQVQVAGWNGYNVINTNGICTYANSSSQYAQIRFTFGTNYIYDNNYLGLKVIKILGYGGVGWITPSNLARNGHLYSYDNNQNAYFPADVRSDTLVKANGFVKYNGTSNQFLKADGSVDSSAYVTGSGVTTIVSLTQQDYDNIITKDPNTLYFIK